MGLTIKRHVFFTKNVLMTILIYIVVRIIISSISKLIYIILYLLYTIHVFLTNEHRGFGAAHCSNHRFMAQRAARRAVRFASLATLALQLGITSCAGYMVISINVGTPESSILDWGFPWSSYWGTPICGNPHIRSVFLSIFPGSGQANQKWGELWNYRDW